MNEVILIATPNVGIGNLIFQTIEESGKYSVTLVNSGEDAIKQFKQYAPKICIVDEMIQDIQIDIFIKQTHDIDSEISLVVIPSGDKDETEEKTLNVDAFLHIPFYTPDLLSMVDDILNVKISSETRPSQSLKLDHQSFLPESEVVSSSELHWLEDNSYAEQELIRLSLESSSEGSLIIHRGEIWASAGELSQSAANELIQTIEDFFGGKGGSDLAKYIHLKETDKDYMLYATSLGKNYVLVVVFDFKVPFSKIRSETNKIANNLKNLQSEENSEEIKEKLLPHKSNLLKIKSLLEIGSTELEHEEKLDDLDFQEDDESLVGEKQILESYDEITEPLENIGIDDLLAETQFSSSSDDVKEQETKELQADQDDFEELEETVLSKVSEEEDTPSKIVLEPVSPSIYNLNYACVLIPRFSEQFLTGSRATRLSEWVTQLCLAFGWRLEQLSIRPEYIQWIVNVPPSTSPGYLIRIIRQHTSRRMFTDFPGLEKINPSGDFWAPGYLIMNGNKPPPVKLIKEFIKNSRTRQGV